MITGTSLVMQSASATVPGLVNGTTQQFAGNKEFLGNIIGDGTLTLNLLTAGRALVSGTGGLIQGSATTSTEISYVNGVTSAIQTQLNAKQATLTIGDLTDTGTDGIIVGNGTGSVIGSGTTISQHVADATHNGYLLNTDWVAFNSKQASGSYITALTGDVTASGPGSVAASIAATTNATLTTLSALSLPATQLSGTIVAGRMPALTGDVTSSAGSVATTLAATTNATITTLSALSLPATQLSGTIVAGRMPAFTGDITTSAGAVATTLATVNSNVGSFTNANITVNAKGLVTAASNGSGSSAVAPTIQKFTSSTGTYTTPTSPAPLYIRVVMVGGGGGGGGAGTGDGGNGGAGGNTTFGTTLLAANGGAATTGSGQVPGVGGTVSLGSGPIGTAIAGGPGSYGIDGLNVIFSNGGDGAVSPFGGAGQGGGGNQTAGSAAIANSGSGGGGGDGTTAAGVKGGAGGSAGGYVDAIITSPSSTYAYAIGAAGSAGSAGTNGAAGAAGGSGYIIVYEMYQ